jgi:hypothetical protein
MENDTSTITRCVTYPETESGVQYTIESDNHHEKYFLVKHTGNKTKIIKDAETPDILQDYVEKKLLKWQCAQ